MNLYKPKFWQSKNNFFFIIFLPVTYLILYFIYFKKKLTKSKYFKIPILCIGNIYVGGTGKTPLAIFIASELKKLKKNPAIIKKFYKAHKDEHMLIKDKLNSLILDKDRTSAIKIAEKKYDLAILDDGFQDYKINKDLNILCFHSKQLIGNGYSFPSGPLRESKNSIKDAQIIVINGKKNIKFERNIMNLNSNTQIFYSEYILTGFEKYKNKKILAIAGIGNPDNFFDLLIQYGLKVKKTLSFPDHYNFSENELDKIIRDANTNDLTILTTEKDFLRIQKFKLNKINFCKINLKIFEKEKLINQIIKLYDKKL